MKVAYKCKKCLNLLEDSPCRLSFLDTGNTDYPTICPFGGAVEAKWKKVKKKKTKKKPEKKIIHKLSKIDYVHTRLSEVKFSERKLLCGECKEVFISDTGIIGNYNCPNGCKCVLEWIEE